MSAKESYWWINAIALALSVLIAKMSISAYEAAGALDNAWICVTCQAIAIVCAVMARRALTGQMPVSGVVCIAAALGAAWWASHGLGLAWEAGGDRANEWMVFFLTALEPSLFLLAEHIREGREALRAAHAKDEEETAAELARIRSQDSARWGPRLATAGGVALAASPAAANVGDVALPPALSAEPTAIVSTNTGYATKHAHALALARSNPALTQEQIGAQIGAPRSTVGKWLRDASKAA